MRHESMSGPLVDVAGCHLSVCVQCGCVLAGSSPLVLRRGLGSGHLGSVLGADEDGSRDANHVTHLLSVSSL